MAVLCNNGLLLEHVIRTRRSSAFLRSPTPLHGQLQVMFRLCFDGGLQTRVDIVTVRPLHADTPLKHCAFVIRYCLSPAITITACHPALIPQAQIPQAGHQLRMKWLVGCSSTQPSSSATTHRHVTMQGRHTWIRHTSITAATIRSGITLWTAHAG